MKKIITYTALMTLGLTIAPAYSSLSENYVISANTTLSKNAIGHSRLTNYKEFKWYTK